MDQLAMDQLAAAAVVGVDLYRDFRIVVIAAFVIRL